MKPDAGDVLADHQADIVPRTPLLVDQRLELAYDRGSRSRPCLSMTWICVAIQKMEITRRGSSGWGDRDRQAAKTASLPYHAAPPRLRMSGEPISGSLLLDLKLGGLLQAVEVVASRKAASRHNR